MTLQIANECTGALRGEAPASVIAAPIATGERDLEQNGAAAPVRLSGRGSAIYRKILTLDTERKTEFRTVTHLLRDCIAESGIECGTLLVYSLHTTMGLVIQETSEPNLCEDFADFMVQMVEDNGHLYKHRCALHPSGACHEDRFNGPSHVRQLLTNQSVILDVHAGDLTLGQWQDVAIAEMDGPRKGRKIFVKIIPDW